MSKKWVFLFVFFLIFIGFLMKNASLSQTAMNPAPLGQAVLIVDAGHGGEDGGAVSASGSIESHINLQIALQTRDLLAWFGVSPIMTREEDVSLHDHSAQTLREKKVSDLKNRTTMVENTKNAILISIHQNSFTDPRYRGTQIFFAQMGHSAAFAGVMRESFDGWTSQITNLRENKPVPAGVYLMNHISKPAILIECGFLSNPEEERMLLSSRYQKRLAAAITMGCLRSGYFL